MSSSLSTRGPGGSQVDEEAIRALDEWLKRELPRRAMRFRLMVREAEAQALSAKSDRTSGSRRSPPGAR